MRLRLGELTPFAAALDLDLDRSRACFACLSFISSSLRHCDEREARSWTRRLTPTLWREGLDAPALEAVRKASDSGLPHAAACLEDLEARGGDSVVARAIVLKLGAELAKRERIEFALREQARVRLASAPPEWN